MSQVIENHTFEQHGLYRLPPVLENLELQRCTFESCQHPAQKRLEERPLLRNVTLLRCHVNVSDLGPVIAEDCLVDTIWFHRGKWGPQRVSGCALKHVTIRGNVTGGLRFLASPLWTQWQTEFVSDKKRRSRKAKRGSLEYGWQRALLEEGKLRGSLPSLANRFARANTRFYADVDWALDISDAHFTGVELERSGIPARLIRRDPETQAVVHRKVLLESDWRDVVADFHWRYGIEWFLETGFDDTVLVACKRGRFFEKEMACIARLRAAGLADSE